MAQAIWRDHIHGTAKHLRQIRLKFAEIEKRSAGLHFDQEVNIAVRTILAANNGTEQPHGNRAMQATDFQNPATLSLELRQAPQC